MTVTDAPLLLEMRGITKRFGQVTALRDVNLAVRRGEIHAICGENGAGKSTLMKVLSGIYPHGSYDGEIVFDGSPCEFKDIRSSERCGIAIIHQELALVPVLSIAENIFLGNEHARAGVINWHETMTRAQELLGRVGLRENPNTRISDIGVGKQQLVEIAKALSKRVRLLILDEPTAALNDEDSRHLLDLILELRSQGLTCIIISHKLNEVMRVADTVTILRDGRTIETRPVGHGLTEEHIIRGMVGRDMTDRFPDREPRPIGDVALAIENWTVLHPLDQQRRVVDDVSLHVRRGEIVGLAGLMGAGRTELAMSVFGRSYGKYVSGRVVKDGREIRTRTVPEAVDHGIVYVTEDRKHYGLNLMDDIARSITLASLPKVSNRTVINEHNETMVAERYRRDMRIKAPSVRATTGNLSGGNQQKVVLSKWIFADPDVLILDEPTRGIDVGAKYEIYQIINSLAAQGKAVIVISSELPELIGLCDRIYTLNEGRLTGEVPREQATQETLMRYMMKGHTA
ncbi:ABC transporter ATP-binding protein [Mycolicibacterium phlei]|uniref:Xylose ABC transporter ATP-binding protein n=2 Tax=Mycolicibacterium phlei TaxID=1771 RepID=A0A5N5V7K2_MYCPH|nr:Xylose import ATP-binding protein XylG [Mycolicibacterium phlei]KAB7756590.1 xylose ABC transporter ATP-binding protein [Mycolicibacterium phlei DSM 43239 = CCUG 21000]KXW73131.1 xylose ABC transporter ATP-binding protein [Mycolicibacterium phlei DSM 43070]VEG08494.1 ABC transporter ATP-binding protein [Mycobacteroides chelonae]KXW63477.1 xylose ABC transporter ATP-binding protein [Mycolicibacterium phlei DSM 43239 = CCUG 21000]